MKELNMKANDSNKIIVNKMKKNYKIQTKHKFI